MDQNYIKETIRSIMIKEMPDIEIRKLKKVIKILDRSLHDQIMKFHKFQNEELQKELLIKEIRLRKLEQRIDD